jgi:hypothetical protein
MVCGKPIELDRTGQRIVIDEQRKVDVTQVHTIQRVKLGS